MEGNWCDGKFTKGVLSTPILVGGKSKFEIDMNNKLPKIPEGTFYNGDGQFYFSAECGINICNVKKALFEGNISSKFKVSGRGYRYYRVDKYHDLEYKESLPNGNGLELNLCKGFSMSFRNILNKSTSLISYDYFNGIHVTVDDMPEVSFPIMENSKIEYDKHTEAGRIQSKDFNISNGYFRFNDEAGNRCFFVESVCSEPFSKQLLTKLKLNFNYVFRRYLNRHQGFIDDILEMIRNHMPNHYKEMNDLIIKVKNEKQKHELTFKNIDRPFTDNTITKNKITDESNSKTQIPINFAQKNDQQKNLQSSDFAILNDKLKDQKIASLLKKDIPNLTNQIVANIETQNHQKPDRINETANAVPSFCFNKIQNNNPSQPVQSNFDKSEFSKNGFVNNSSLKNPNYLTKNNEWFLLEQNQRLEDQKLNTKNEFQTHKNQDFLSLKQTDNDFTYLQFEKRLRQFESNESVFKQIPINSLNLEKLINSTEIAGSQNHHEDISETKQRDNYQQLISKNNLIEKNSRQFNTEMLNNQVSNKNPIKTNIEMGSNFMQNDLKIHSEQIQKDEEMKNAFQSSAFNQISNESINKKLVNENLHQTPKFIFKNSKPKSDASFSNSSQALANNEDVNENHPHITQSILNQIEKDTELNTQNVKIMEKLITDFGEKSFIQLENNQQKEVEEHQNVDFNKNKNDMRIFEKPKQEENQKIDNHKNEFAIFENQIIATNETNQIITNQNDVEKRTTLQKDQKEFFENVIAFPDICNNENKQNSNEKFLPKRVTSTNSSPQKLNQAFEKTLPKREFGNLEDNQTDKFEIELNEKNEFELNSKKLGKNMQFDKNKTKDFKADSLNISYNIVNLQDNKSTILSSQKHDSSNFDEQLLSNEFPQNNDHEKPPKNSNKRNMIDSNFGKDLDTQINEKNQDVNYSHQFKSFGDLPTVSQQTDLNLKKCEENLENKNQTNQNQQSLRYSNLQNERQKNCKEEEKSNKTSYFHYLHTSDVVFFDGRLINGLKNGFCTEIRKNGSIIRGTFKNDLIHGECVIINPSREMLKGVFEEGEPVGKFAKITPDEKCVIGEIKMDRFLSKTKVEFNNYEIETDSDCVVFPTGPAVLTSLKEDYRFMCEFQNGQIKTKSVGKVLQLTDNKEFEGIIMVGKKREHFLIANSGETFLINEAKKKIKSIGIDLCGTVKIENKFRSLM